MELVLVIFGTIYLFVLEVLMRPYWTLLKNEARRTGGRLQFTISDCWAASIGLSGTALIVAHYLERRSPAATAMDSFLIVFYCLLFFGTGQLAGIAMVLATNAAPSRKIRKNGACMMWVIIGALFGLTIPITGPLLLVCNRVEQWLHPVNNTGDFRRQDRARRSKRKN